MLKNKCCVLVDDMVDTAGTFVPQRCAEGRGRQAGGRLLCAPGLVRPAVDNIMNSEMDELVVTDTIPLSEAAQACGKIRQLSIAQMLAETIRRMAQGESVSLHVRGLSFPFFPG